MAIVCPARRTTWRLKSLLEIRLNAGGEQRTIAITMRTPGNDYELAAGFLYNEGVIHDKHDIVQMTYCVGSDRDLQEYNVLDVRLRAPNLPELPQLERHFFTNSACGVCGATMLDDLHERGLLSVPDGPQVAPETLNTLPTLLRKEQRLFESTGGLHTPQPFLMRTGPSLRCVRMSVGTMQWIS